MIRLSNVSKRYRTDTELVSAVEGISIEIPKGEVSVLEGPNASGKTTVLSLIAGITSPTTGRVYIDGLDISRLPERFISVMRREKIGIIFQERHIISDATVFENLTIPLIPTDMKSREIKKTADGVLSHFGLKRKESFKVNEITGGEKQRLAIARAFINDPEIILADEPTTHLDENHYNMFVKDVKGLGQKGKTIVIATHDRNLLKGIDADVVIRLDQGHIEKITKKGKR